MLQPAHTQIPTRKSVYKLGLKLQCCKVQEQNSNWPPPPPRKSDTEHQQHTPLKGLDNPSLLTLCTAAAHPFHSPENKEDELHFRAWHSSTKSQQAHLLQHLKVKTLSVSFSPYPG